MLDASHLPAKGAARVWITWQSLASRRAEATHHPVMVALETPRLVSGAAANGRSQSSEVSKTTKEAAGRDVTRTGLLQAFGNTVLTAMGSQIDFARADCHLTESHRGFPLGLDRDSEWRLVKEASLHDEASLPRSETAGDRRD